MTLAEKLRAVRKDYECTIAKLKKEPNLCQRCGGWGKVGVSELGCSQESVMRMREMEPDCGLCGGTGKVRVCNSCGSIH